MAPIVTVMCRLIYRVVMFLAQPGILVILGYRRLTGKEDKKRQRERLGYPTCTRPTGSLIWCHAASIGESLSILPLIIRLLERYPDLTILVTTCTVTSASVLAQRLPDRAIHHYIPFDHQTYIIRFLNHWQPDLVLWTESELWPNTLMAIHERRIPAALLNARMSLRSFQWWSRMPTFAREMISVFQLGFAQSSEDAQRWQALGFTNIHDVGNLKYASDPLPVDDHALALLRKACNGRSSWIYASSHPGEEEIALRVHKALMDHIPTLLTFLVPRSPYRGAEIMSLVHRYGLIGSQRRTGALPRAEDACYIADTIGEMGLWFRLSKIVFIGGSLVPRGGQNPIEPAQLGCTIMFGPHMYNFKNIAQHLRDAKAAVLVDNEQVLIKVLSNLLRDSALCHTLADAAYQVTSNHREIVDRIMDGLSPLLIKAGI